MQDIQSNQGQNRMSMRKVSMGVTLILAVLGLIASGQLFNGVIAAQEQVTRSTSWAVGGEFQLSWSVDGLSAFYILVLLLGQALSSFYAWGYLREYQGKKSLTAFALMWFGFLGSMYGVILADDGFSFLLTWELMSLFSFFLVLYEHESADNRRAAFIYLVMTHVGTVFIMAAVLFLYAGSGEFSYQAWIEYVPLLSSWQRNLLFLAFLIGFGTKAGFVPLHIWLPYAHSTAPSPVSALMSGVMVKLALYLILRMLWLIMGIGPLWWGGILVVIGTLSALVGITLASLEGDVKRLLAYSTVENVGILTIALGVAFIGRSLQNEGIVVIALAAFFWHTLQHLLFKSTLFMGAGNVIQAVHTRRLEQMGGLGRKLPRTMRLTLVAVIGIAAIPPLSGFWGEWLLFQSLWRSAVLPTSGWIKISFPLVIALLGLVGGLAVAAYVKWFGSIFIGQARSMNTMKAEEAHLSQQLAMALGVALTIITVLQPAKILQGIGVPLQVLGSGNENILVKIGPLLEPLSSLQERSLTFLVIGGLFLGVFSLVQRGSRRRLAPTWNCGGEDLNPRMQYSSAGINMPLRIMLSSVLRVKPEVQKELGESKYLVNSLNYRGEPRKLLEEWVYRPLTQGLLSLSQRIRGLQGGSIHLYLAYILGTLVVVLLIQ